MFAAAEVAITPAARWSDLGALGQGRGVPDGHAKVAGRSLGLRVPERDPHGAQIARLLGDQGRLRAPQRVRAVVLAPEPDTGDPSSLDRPTKLIPATFRYQTARVAPKRALTSSRSACGFCAAHGARDNLSAGLR